VSQAVVQMEKVTQTTAAAAEESAAASEELSAQAECSVEIVRQLEDMVSHASRSGAPTAGPDIPGRRLPSSQERLRRMESDDSSATRASLGATGTDGPY
jgi:hypothetical protein